MADLLEYTNLVTSQHNDKPKFMAMVAALVQPKVDTQNILDTFPSLFDVYQATGDQLDILGEWIGASRNLAVPLAGVFFSFQPNLISDPDNVNGTWSYHGGPMQSTRTGKGWVTPGSGAVQISFWASPGIPVVPGNPYTFVGTVDASAAISGNPSIGLYDNTSGSPDFSTGGLVGILQTPGVNGQLSRTFIVPPGVTSVVAIVDSFNAVVPVGKSLQHSALSLSPEPRLGWGEGTWFSQFDNIAGLVVLPDDSYRVLLLSVIASNQWDGTVPGSYSILQLLYQLSGFQVLIQDNQDMTISIILLATTVDAVFSALLHSGLIAMRPAGVRVAGYFKATTPVFGWGIDTPEIGGWGVGSWIQLTQI